MTVHLYHAHELGAAQLRELATGISLCGKQGVSRDQLTVFREDADCPACLARAERRPIRETTDKLFVYGTLKRAYRNNGLLETAIFLGEATSAEADYRMLDAGVPYLVAGGDSKVRGELYQLSPEVLGRIDRLEGHPYHYCREVRDFVDADGQVHAAWVYLRASQQLGNLRRVRPNAAGELDWEQSS